MEKRRIPITVTVNGHAESASVEPRTLLVHFLRENLGLRGTHVGCDTSQCGSCTVMLGGQAVKSCTVFAVQADGSRVQTIEGLEDNGVLHPVQQAFWEKHGLQCGFCTPGAMMTAISLLSGHPRITETEIREGLDGLMCRCTGYETIVRSVIRAQEIMSERADAVAQETHAG